MSKRTFTIDALDAGARLDKFLAEQMPEFSRSEIQKMQKNFPNARKLKPGDAVEIEIPEPEEEGRGKNEEGRDGHGFADLPFSVIYEDDDVIAVNKPRGMVIYPAAGNKTGTLAQLLADYCPLSKLGGGARPGVVHRIDKDTSGIVLLAKSDAAFRALVRTFSEHDLVRKYVAFVRGVPSWTAADIEGNIARSTRNRQKMSMVKSGGKAAKTYAEVVRVWPRANISELKCTLLTGRTHQIRVHLSAHGFSVLTDPVYGRGKESKVKPGKLLDFLLSHKGQCLHADILELAHPTTGAPLKIRAPLPDDLRELRDALDDY